MFVPISLIIVVAFFLAAISSCSCFGRGGMFITATAEAFVLGDSSRTMTRDKPSSSCPCRFVVPLFDSRSNKNNDDDEGDENDPLGSNSQQGQDNQRQQHSDDDLPVPSSKEVLERSRYWILVVDDEESIRRDLGDFLRDAGYKVTACADAAAATKVLRPDTAAAASRVPSAIYSDIRMLPVDNRSNSAAPVNDGGDDGIGRDSKISSKNNGNHQHAIAAPDNDGLEFVRALREKYPRIPVVLSAKDIAEYNPVAYACLPKPFDRAELLSMLDDAISHRQWIETREAASRRTSSTTAAHETAFKSKDELKEWLQSQGIRDDPDGRETADNVAGMLFAAEYTRPSAFYGITSDEVHRAGVGYWPMCHHVSGTLQQQRQQRQRRQDGGRRNISLMMGEEQYEVDISGIRSLDELIELAQTTFETTAALELRFYRMGYPGPLLNDDRQVSYLQAGAKITATDLRVDLRDVKDDEYLFRNLGFDYPDINDKMFAPFEVDVPEVSQENPHVRHAIETIQNLQTAAPDPYKTEGSSARLYVDAILIAAANLEKGLTMSTGEMCESPWVRGPVDYVFYYNKIICLCVAEGKQGSIRHGIAQNLAQLGAVRYNRQRRRTRDGGEERSPETACYGISTIYIFWVFTRVDDSGVSISKKYMMDPRDPSYIRKMIIRVMLLLRHCKAEVDKVIATSKKQRT